MATPVTADAPTAGQGKVRTWLLHCSKRKACVSYTFESGRSIISRPGASEASALYEAPFSGIHSGGPDELFAGKENVIEGIFEKPEEVRIGLLAEAG